MGGIGEERTEGHDHLDAEVTRDAEQLVGEGLPAHRGLDAVHEDHIARCERNPCHGDAGRRPRDRPDAILDGDLGAVDLEVVVVLGVHLGDLSRGPDLLEVQHRGAGGIAGVVPAFERAQHDRIDEVGQRVWRTVVLDHRAPLS